MYSLQPVTQHFLPICVRYSVVLCSSAIHSPVLFVPCVYRIVASCSWVTLSLNVSPTNVLHLAVLFHCLSVYIAVLYKYFVVGVPAPFQCFSQSSNPDKLQWLTSLPSCERASDSPIDMPDVVIP
jgi:hypothetical protein